MLITTEEELEKMDSGGYRVIYDHEPYTICDETDYFAVYLDYKQIAAFKTKDLAFEYAEWKRGLNVRLLEK